MGCVLKDSSLRSQYCCCRNYGKSYTHLKEYSEPDGIYHVNQGAFPTNIRNLHMTQQASLILVTERVDDVTRRVRIAVVCVFILSIVSLAVAFTLLKVQTYKGQQDVLKFEDTHPADIAYGVVTETLTSVIRENVSTSTDEETKAGPEVKTKDRQSLHNGLYCTDVCRQYSAFRFRSSCVQHKCSCQGQGYQTDSCLPKFRNCAIGIQERKPFASVVFQQEDQNLYTCKNPREGTSEIHVIGNYGNNHKPWTNVDIADERTNRTAVTLVLANYQKVKWHIQVQQGVWLDKVYLISNKNLRRSEVVVNQTDSRTDTEIVRLFSHVGYGEDKYGGHTLELLQTVYDLIGDITSFSGTPYANEWRLNLHDYDFDSL